MIESKETNYRDRLKDLYVVVISLFLLLLTCSAWPCLGPALQDLYGFQYTFSDSQGSVEYYYAFGILGLC